MFEDSWLEISWETLGQSNGLMRQVYLLDVWGRRNPGPSRLVKLVTLWSGKITKGFFREFDPCQRLTFSNDLLIANVLHEKTEISGWFAPMMSMWAADSFSMVISEVRPKPSLEETFLGGGFVGDLDTCVFTHPLGSISRLPSRGILHSRAGQREQCSSLGCSKDSGDVEHHHAYSDSPVFCLHRSRKWAKGCGWNASEEHS